MTKEGRDYFWQVLSVAAIFILVFSLIGFALVRVGQLSELTHSCTSNIDRECSNKKQDDSNLYWK